jgi:hypothetical protein
LKITKIEAAHDTFRSHDLGNSDAQLFYMDNEGGWVTPATTAFTTLLVAKSPGKECCLPGPVRGSVRRAGYESR